MRGQGCPTQPHVDSEPTAEGGGKGPFSSETEKRDIHKGHMTLAEQTSHMPICPAKQSNPSNNSEVGLSWAIQCVPNTNLDEPTGVVCLVR